MESKYYSEIFIEKKAGSYRYSLDENKKDIMNILDDFLCHYFDDELLFGDINEKTKNIYDVEYSFGAISWHNNFLAGIIIKGQFMESKSNIYHPNIYIIKRESTFHYLCDCKEFRTNTPCKHLFSLALWVKNNPLYAYSKLKSIRFTDDITNEKINILDKEINVNVVNNIKGLRKHFCEDTCNKIMLFEKICRYIEKGIDCFDEYQTLWSDRAVRDYFKKHNKTFDVYVKKILDDSQKIYEDYWRKSDYDYFEERNIFNKIFDIKDINYRIKNIDFSIVYNPYKMEQINDFVRLINTYGRITKFKCNDEFFEGKYILIPKHLEFLVVEASKVPSEFYENFKLGEKKFEDGFALKDENDNVMLIIYNWIKNIKS